MCKIKFSCFCISEILFFCYFRNNSSSKESSLSPAVERKPLKSARAEAARRSRTRGKANKAKDSKASKKIQKQCNGAVIGLSDVTEQTDLNESSSKPVLSSQDSNSSLLGDWTTDDWPALTNGSQEDFVIYQKFENDLDLDTQLNSDSVVASNSGRSSVASLQGEVNFIPHHANILSTTSSKTASPIIEFDIVEAYNPSNNHDMNSAGNSDFDTAKVNMTDIESELSSEVVAFVNEVIEENSNTNLSELSPEDKLKFVEELKTLLQFYPIENDEERQKAEILIYVKICQSGTKSQNTLESSKADSNISDHYMIKETAKSEKIDEHIVNGNIAEVNGQSTELDQTCAALHEVELERMSNGSIDLDNSLNKEVANIMNGSHLQEIEHNSGIQETLYQQETIEIASDLANNTEAKSNCNHCVENNEVEMTGTLKHQNDNVTSVAQEVIAQQECLESQKLKNLSEIIPNISPKEKSPREKTSIYDIDSAIIRAETSDIGETDSLFEHDSAIIAVKSTDSLERDSLLETDSAIIAASTDIKDTNNISMLGTDSAIIAASKDLLDAEVIVDDSDVMRRLKATVEELKYWGHLETEESESVAKVVPEWDGFDQGHGDGWQNDATVRPVRAKPQRKRRHKSESNNDEENVLKQSDKEGKIDAKIGDLDTSNSSQDEVNEKIIEEAAGQSDVTNSEPLTNHNRTQTISSTEREVDSDNPSYSQLCSNNNSELYNTELFMDPVESGIYVYQNNEDVLNGVDSDLLQYEIPIVLPDPDLNDDTAIVRTGAEFQKESDLENSIFISDDEENLDNSRVSKSDSEAWKTASSDDNIFVSDDDMDILSTNFKVDGLQTVAIQEETIPNENSETGIEDNIPVGLTVSDEQEELTHLNLQQAESGQHASSENSFLYETASSVGNENETSINEENNVIDIDWVVNDKEGLKETEMIPLCTSSEINATANSNACPTSDNFISEEVKEPSPGRASSPKKQRPSKRRLAAKLSEPFFGVSDAEKFASNDWNTLSSVFSKTDASIETNVDKTKETEFKSEGTLTESGDFRLLTLFCTGENVEYVPDYIFVKTRSRSIDLSEEELSRYSDNLEKPVSSEIRMIDKSSSTDDLKTDSDIENIQFLKTCFPNISEDELDCVLINCSNNVEWALNLLLDWKYHMDYTDEEKENFAKEISKCKRCPSPEHLDLSNEISVEDNPESLLDLCFKKIDKENIAARVDLEKQLIQTGKERLDRIEDDNITKIRLRRSTSLSESSYDRSSISAGQSFERVLRSVSDPHQNNDTVFVNTPKHDKSGHSVKSSMISPIKKIIEKTSGLDKSSNKRINSEAASARSIESSISFSEENSVNKSDAFAELNATGLNVADSLSSVKGNDLDQRGDNIIFSGERGPSLSSPRETEHDISLTSASSRDRSLTSPGPVVFMLELNKHVISQLEGLFGPVGENSITGGFDCVIIAVYFESYRLILLT